MSQTKGSGPRSAQDTTAEYASPEPGDCFFLVCNYGSSNIGKVRESLPPAPPCSLVFLILNSHIHTHCPLTGHPVFMHLKNDKTRGTCGPLPVRSQESLRLRSCHNPRWASTGPGAQEASGMPHAFLWSSPGAPATHQGNLSSGWCCPENLASNPEEADWALALHLIDDV